MGRNIYIAARNRPFITEWTVSGDATARTITLPLVNSRTEGSLLYNCIVDWGDGSAISYIAAYTDSTRSHIYASSGTYRVTITGICEGWGTWWVATDKLKFTDIISWGGGTRFQGFKFLNSAFAGCSNLKSFGPANSMIPARGTGILTNGFGSTFSSCSKPTSIPANLFKLHTAVTTGAFLYTFGGCSSLTTIPEGLFAFNPLASTSAFRMTFASCTNISGAIPTGLFTYNTSVSSSGFERCFEMCTKITSIPAGLFSTNTAVTTQGFYQTFNYCSGITNLPDDLFVNCTLVSSGGFWETFRGCTGMISVVHAGFFDPHTALTSSGFQGTFKECSKLTSVPANLFNTNTNVSSSGFMETFMGCSSLDCVIPTNFFINNTKVSTLGFQNTFSGCLKLTYIPANLFDTNTLVSTYGFSGTFNGCAKINCAIPTNLFINNTKVSTNGFSTTFKGCNLITSIPDHLFDTNTLLSGNGFNETFSGCPGIVQAVNTDLFKFNPSNSSFYGVFNSDTGLTSFPDNLFDAATGCGSNSFRFTFNNCSGLNQAIPAGLFDNNPLVGAQGFYATFAGCSKLTSAPDGLFRVHTSAAAETFFATFQKASNLTMSKWIFYNAGEEGTRFLNKSVGFGSFFDLFGFTGIAGQAPELWKCNFGTGTPILGAYIFHSLLSLTNYYDIPITMVLDVAPATDWAVGDIVTGQTSGKTCLVVKKITATQYWVNHEDNGAWTLGEIVGVTEVSGKLADQGGTRPIWAGDFGRAKT